MKDSLMMSGLLLDEELANDVVHMFELHLDKCREALKDAEEDLEGVAKMRDTIRRALALGMTEEEVLQDLLGEGTKST